jgi:putative (di)nucleoside polyphosphate hydrolase
MKNKNKKTHLALTFRAGVGAIILNKDGLVLGLERKDILGAWQFPQGGLKADETPLQAVKREIQEETGIGEDDLELLSTLPRWLAYELPEEVRTKKLGRGQVLRWFLFRFKGQDRAITLGNKKEFKAWKWSSMDEMVSIVVSFKQPIYQELAEYFRLYLNDPA